jgi:orotidine-5'-phosphate decarboxylase
MKIQSLTEQIRKKSSFLCVGLDSDTSKLPSSVSQHPEAQFTFNKQIIDATHDLAVAYKINTAFYESDGSKGYQALEKTVQYLDENYPNHFTIADAKRGDIGNTSTQYAKAFFEKLPFDSITVAPYMGRDSIEPFLQFEGKYAILLALTSNMGAYDFQTLNTVDRSIYETVIATSRTWKGADRLMYVLGATKTDHLASIRALAPNSFFLIPGVGAQGGDLASVFHAAANEDVGLLVNSSRSIIFASNGDDYTDAARMASMDLQQQMKKLL